MSHPALRCALAGLLGAGVGLAFAGLVGAGVALAQGGGAWAGLAGAIVGFAAAVAVMLAGPAAAVAWRLQRAGRPNANRAGLVVIGMMAAPVAAGFAVLASQGFEHPVALVGLVAASAAPVSAAAWIATAPGPRPPAVRVASALGTAVAAAALVGALVPLTAERTAPGPEIHRPGAPSPLRPSPTVPAPGP